MYTLSRCISSVHVKWNKCISSSEKFEFKCRYCSISEKINNFHCSLDMKLSMQVDIKRPTYIFKIFSLSGQKNMVEKQISISRHVLLHYQFIVRFHFNDRLETFFFSWAIKVPACGSMRFPMRKIESFMNVKPLNNFPFIEWYGFYEFKQQKMYWLKIMNEKYPKTITKNASMY